jgi:periplasmic divalent cation tolerance protein
MEEFIQVTTAAGSRKEAEKIAEAIVAARLAACAQVIGPVSSVYWWEKRVEKAEEWLCLMKTRRDLFGALSDEIRKLHSYSVPEIIATPIIEGQPDYLRWLADETRTD